MYMTIIKEVTVEGTRYPVTVSDDNEALQAAAAAGRAIVGIWEPDGRKTGAGFDACLYLVCEPEAADERLLERVVRRQKGLPWLITETERLLIREFSVNDPLEPASEDDGDGVFSDHRLRAEYIAGRYRYYECGLWALEEKRSGNIIGKAGITDGELGYHIYKPYRSRGYALEACRAILVYAEEELALEQVLLRTERDNKASVCLAEKLGFSLIENREEAGEGNRTEFLMFEKNMTA